MAISALVNLGRADACDAAVQRLAGSQLADGSWPAEAFCIDPAIKQKVHYSGASALATALAMEAITLHQQSGRSKPSAVAPATTNTFEQTLITNILETARQDMSELSATLKHQTWNALESMRQEDVGKEVMLLAHLFNQSLQQPIDNPHALTHLGLANLYGWAAYTVYDDFMDDEGQPHKLPAANVALRYSLEHFRQALPGDAAFQTCSLQTFDQIDAANAEELEQCRAQIAGEILILDRTPAYPDTLKLADRSIGHTLSPLGVLAAMGIPPHDRRAKAVHLALRHYLAARQLNDDLHDWEQDCKAGIITYVVANIFRGIKLQPGQHALAKLVPDMQSYFWNRALPDICTVISRHTALARRSAAACGLLKQENIVTRLTEGIDAVVQKTMAEQTKAVSFLAAYAGKTADHTIPKARTRSSPKTR